MTKLQIEQFLTRIGLDKSLADAPLDYSLLCKIQYAAVTHIPYENIDILNGIPLKFDEEGLFDKIVTRHRGGYCFELNGIIIHVLRSMGYEVKDYFARYICGVEGIPMRRHRVAVVSCEGKRYLCDIGSRHPSPMNPLEMVDDVEQNVPGGKFMLTHSDFYGHLQLQWHNGEWREMFGFTEEEQLDIDYEMPSFWCEKHPDSPFTKQLIVGIKTADGIKSLTDDRYTVSIGDVITETVIPQNEISDVLKNEFMLEV